MKLSVVIITKNEAPRLRLCLASVAESFLQLGEYRSNVVVVDDGSCDETPACIAEFAQELPLTRVRHDVTQGRSASRNAGAASADGDIILFLDGDTLIAPQTTLLHLRTHRESLVPVIARGIAHHMRQTRFLRDPETGEPFPFYSDRPIEKRELVTKAEILAGFDSLLARTALGIYPGMGPRALAELEISALRESTIEHSLWMTMIAHNFSVSKSLFQQCGGFLAALDMNEHRELALSLSENSTVRVRLVENAFSIHLCHTAQWRDPLQTMRSWEPIFLARHPTPEAKLLPFFWLSLAPNSEIPGELLIPTIPELIRRARGDISPYERFRDSSRIFAGVAP